MLLPKVSETAFADIKEAAKSHLEQQGLGHEARRIGEEVRREAAEEPEQQPPEDGVKLQAADEEEWQRLEYEARRRAAMRTRWACLEAEVEDEAGQNAADQAERQLQE